MVILADCQSGGTLTPIYISLASQWVPPAFRKAVDFAMDQIGESLIVAAL